jgi:hypothetical protein
MPLALADRLFGGTEPIPGPSRHWLLRYLGVTALLAAIIVVRRPDAVTNPQFWAEDGYVFFYENLTLGFPHALAKLYFGFPYLAHRLIAFAGGLVPFALAPRVYTTSAIAITALGLATFALPAFRHLVRSDGLRVLFGVVAVSAPFDQDVLSNPTIFGWSRSRWFSYSRETWERGLGSGTRRRGTRSWSIRAPISTSMPASSRTRRPGWRYRRG